MLGFAIEFDCYPAFHAATDGKLDSPYFLCLAFEGAAVDIIDETCFEPCLTDIGLAVGVSLGVVEFECLIVELSADGRGWASP